MLLTGRRWLIGLVLAGLLVAGLVAAAIPAAAQPETLTLTLLNGTVQTVTVDVPPGTPLDQIKLPPVSSPIIGISVSGGAAAGAPAGGSAAGAPAVAVPGVSSASQQATTTLAPVVKGQAGQRLTGHKKRAAGPGVPSGVAVPKAVKPVATPIRLANGVPLAGNPTLSLGSFGPAVVGVPNFFIDNFRIPPFLLPIYQAAGVEFDVPWQVLAAINEIETDYGRNLSVSSAGAIGWMQFLPATWRAYGVDATGAGVKDPYNPADAVFAAARYLHAAGASHDLRGAVFAYNHASWYVDSVLLRAKLIGGLPADLVSSITGLTEGHFPVLAPVRYADDISEAKLAARSARSGRAAVLVAGSARRSAINIYSRPGAPVVAVQDGRIVSLGHSARMGNFVVLRDVYGNTYTYSQLKRLAVAYPVAKPSSESAARVASDLRLATDPRPSGPASAGHQAPASPVVAGPVGDVVRQATDVGGAAQRLFAHPQLPGAYAAGGKDQLAGVTSAGFDSYYTQVFGLRRGDVVMRPLRAGARVIAGTILGRIGNTSPVIAPHLQFQVRPAGKGAPLIDPKPILDGWKLLETTAIYRAAGSNALTATSPTIGQVLLASKQQLQQRVLADPNVQIYRCGRADIATGQIDRRVLAALEFLSASGLKPSVSALKCPTGQATAARAHDLAGGNGVDIAAINAIPILGHQGTGSITDITIRRLQALQGIYKPFQIASLMSIPQTDNTLKLPANTDHIHIGYLPTFNPNTKQGRAITTALKPNQWIKLIARLGQISNPTVTTTPSPYAIPDRLAKTAGTGK